MTLTNALPELENIAKGLKVKLAGRNLRLIIEILRLKTKLINLQK